MITSPVAAVDCGTNSTRLLVAGPDGATLERLMTITRLGAGVDAAHALAPAAIDRTVGVLRAYRDVMDRFGVERVRMTATSAARDATNRDDFFAAVRHVVGVTPELLDGNAEGTLSFIGATADLDAAGGPWLVADIGGGSTELAAGPIPGAVDRRVPAGVRSIDVGCVRITERFFHRDPPTGDELAAARAFVRSELERASREVPALTGATALLGLAGTVSALASLEPRLDHYDRVQVHHHRLTRPVVAGLLDELAGQPVAARRIRAGMEAERADVIVGGAVVLDELMAHFGFDDCTVSEADILDGLAFSLLDADT